MTDSSNGIGVDVSLLLILCLRNVLSPDSLASASSVTSAITHCLDCILSWRTLMIEMNYCKAEVKDAQLESYAESSRMTQIVSRDGGELEGLNQAYFLLFSSGEATAEQLLQAVEEATATILRPTATIIGALLKKCHHEDEGPIEGHLEVDITLSGLQKLNKDEMVDNGIHFLGTFISFESIRDIVVLGSCGDSLRLNILCSLQDNNFVDQSNSWLLVLLPSCVGQNKDAEIKGGLEFFLNDVLPTIDELTRRGTEVQEKVSQDADDKIAALELRQIRQLCDQSWSLFPALCRRPGDFAILFDTSRCRHSFNDLLELVLRKKGRDQGSILQGLKLLCKKFSSTVLLEEHEIEFKTKLFQLFNYLFLLYDNLFKELLMSEQESMHVTTRQQKRAAFDSSCGLTFDLVEAIAQIIRGPNTIDRLLPRICDLITKPVQLNEAWGSPAGSTQPAKWITSIEGKEFISEDDLDLKFRLELAKVQFYTHSVPYLSSPDLYHSAFVHWSKVYSWSTNCLVWAKSSGNIESMRCSEFMRYASMNVMNRLFTAVSNENRITFEQIQNNITGEGQDQIKFVSQFLPILSTVDAEVGTLKRLIPLIESFVKFCCRLDDSALPAMHPLWQDFFNEGISPLLSVILLGMRSTSKSVRDPSFALLRKVLSSMDRTCGNLDSCLLYLSGASLLVGGNVAPSALEGFKIIMVQYRDSLTDDQVVDITRTVTTLLKSSKKSLYEQSISFLKECMNGLAPLFVESQISTWTCEAVQNPISKTNNYVVTIKLFIQKAFSKLKPFTKTEFLDLLAQNDFYTDNVKRVAKKALDELSQEKRGVNKGFVGRRHVGAGRTRSQKGHRGVHSIKPLTGTPQIPLSVIPRNPKGLVVVQGKRSLVRKGVVSAKGRTLKKKMK
eukprot:GHVH01012077.1.p1 GENE.GHVH01012077.1~~GHVH01012077.1.p1  ORF type:complete len:897 (-),score=140.40 GHVH01012077.1:58-2748(-)